MPKATKTYSQWRLEKLSDPVRASRYLNAAKRDSKEAFFYALKNVIQANQVARIAKEAGISRESVYRSFSAEGNPTFDTLSSVLEALNIKITFAPIAQERPSGPTGLPALEIPCANSTAGSIVSPTPKVRAIGPVIADYARSLPSQVIKRGEINSLSLQNAGASSESSFLPGFLYQQQQLKQIKGIDGER